MLTFFSSLSLSVVFQAKMPFASGGSFSTFMGCMKISLINTLKLDPKGLDHRQFFIQNTLKHARSIAYACPAFDGP